MIAFLAFQTASSGWLRKWPLAYPFGQGGEISSFENNQPAGQSKPEWVNGEWGVLFRENVDSLNRSALRWRTFPSGKQVFTESHIVEELG